MYNMPYSCLLDDTDSQFTHFLHRASFLSINEKKKKKTKTVKMWFNIKSHIPFYFFQLFSDISGVFISEYA